MIPADLRRVSERSERVGVVGRDPDDIGGGRLGVEEISLGLEKEVRDRILRRRRSLRRTYRRDWGGDHLRLEGRRVAPQRNRKSERRSASDSTRQPLL